MNLLGPPTWIAAAIAALLLGSSSAAQTQEQFIANKKKKLTNAFLRRANWYTDYDKARAEAKASQKLIFAYFTRSDRP